MRKLDPLSRFALFFILIYAALILLKVVFPLGESYQKFYVKAGNYFFAEFSKDGKVLFQEGVDPVNKNMDTMIILFNEQKRNDAIKAGKSLEVVKLFKNSWHNGLLPIFLFMSLILASPVAWGRKFKGIGFGLMALGLFIIFRNWLEIYYSFHLKEQLEMPVISDFFMGLAHFFNSIFVGNIVVTLIVPLLVWVLVTFRKGDLELFVEGQKGK